MMTLLLQEYTNKTNASTLPLKAERNELQSSQLQFHQIASVNRVARYTFAYTIYMQDLFSADCNQTTINPKYKVCWNE